MLGNSCPEQSLQGLVAHKQLPLLEPTDSEVRAGCGLLIKCHPPNRWSTPVSPPP